MSLQTDPYAEVPAEDYHPYRAISKLAVCSVPLAFLSLLSFIAPFALLFALLGVITGGIGLRQIRRYPLELTGTSMAAMGLLVSAVTFVSAFSYHTIVYLTEVPDGYQRIAFNDLKADGKSDVPPPEALALDGKRVFVKGYVYPDGQQFDIKQFVLVGDLGTCCFGGQPKLTHMVQVTLADPLRTEYSYQQRKLGGILRVDTRPKPVSGLQGVYYQLEADYLR